MSYTLSQAAEAAGVSKTTIHRAIRAGKLSAASRNEDGSFSIDPAELHRVFPPKQGNVPGNAKMERGGAPETPSETEGLRAELERLRERVSLLTEERDRERRQLSDQIEDLRHRLDTEGEERRKLTAILTDQRAKAETSPPPPPPRGGFLGLFRRRATGT